MRVLYTNQENQVHYSGRRFDISIIIRSELTVSDCYSLTFMELNVSPMQVSDPQLFLIEGAKYKNPPI